MPMLFLFLLIMSECSLHTVIYDLFPILCSDVQYDESSVMIHVNKNPDVIFMHSKCFS